MNIFLIILIAISLSMDAFSLSLLYGTLGMKKHEKFLLSFITGVFHFFMPLFGYLLGGLIFSYFSLNFNLLTSIILSFIGFQMIISSFKDDEVKGLEFSGFFLFALAVSIDSFSVGITLGNSFNNLFCFLIFAFSSFLFTLLGLYIGSRLESLFGKVSTIIGGFILVVIGLSYLF